MLNLFNLFNLFNLLDMLPITGFYSGFLGGYLVLLSMKVVTQRKLLRIALGDGTIETARVIVRKGDAGGSIYSLFFFFFFFIL